MTPAWWGALLGAAAGAGLLLVVTRLRVLGRPQLSERVLPYVRDLPQVGARPAPRRTQGSPLVGAAVAVYGPVLRTLAESVERVLGGATSVRRRIERAGLDLTVQDFRVQQVVWGLVGLGTTAAWGLLRTLGGDGGVLGHVLVSLWPSPSVCSPATHTSRPRCGPVSGGSSRSSPRSPSCSRSPWLRARARSAPWTASCSAPAAS